MPNNAYPTTREAERSLLFCVLIIAGILLVQSIALAAMGRVFICACGQVKWWYADSSGPETSQHLTDWYTFSHFLHGLIFYFLLWLVAPRAPLWVRLVLAIGLEAAWEIAENTPMVIDRYRQSAMAEGYFGDSIVNSMADTIAAVAGFLFSRISPVWLSIGVLIAAELFVAYMIRDNLTLNVIQLLYPSDRISRWQMGG